MEEACQACIAVLSKAKCFGSAARFKKALRAEFGANYLDFHLCKFGSESNGKLQPPLQRAWSLKLSKLLARNGPVERALDSRTVL